jgi:hypothetical protein
MNEKSPPISDAKDTAFYPIVSRLVVCENARVRVQSAMRICAYMCGDVPMRA